MQTVAEQLHQAREARHLTVQQVADITKIRGDHLRALEAGDFEVFSATVYIRGFVRTYAGVLKMEVPQVMAALDQELRQTTKFAEPPSLSGPPGGVLDVLMLQLSKVDWRRGLGVLAALVVVGGLLAGYFLWRHYQTTDPLRGLSPGAYHSSSNAAGDTLPLPAPRERTANPR
ncbi:MAG TPA: helix-turn-helix domain-containing protein [Dongiaceae bacterium]|nr:helix-turn-helix domain-containing protein [Dongiaceae bacterium]